MSKILEVLKRAATRPRAVYRASRKLGWRIAIRLVFIRMLGSHRARYRLEIPGFAHPVFIRGGKSTDSTALYEVLVYDVYGPAGDLDSPAFIIDGGANIGAASVYFLHRYPTARILAVEPHPENFELCRENLAPYGDRVRLLKGAIWKRPGRLVLDDSRPDWNIRVHSESSGDTGSVEAFTMPQLLAQGGGRVDLLKLDIEGSERELFDSSAQEWLPSVRNLIIELHGKECVARFFEALAEYEFQCLGEIQRDIPVVACLGLRDRPSRLAAQRG